MAGSRWEENDTVRLCGAGVKTDLKKTDFGACQVGFRLSLSALLSVSNAQVVELVDTHV